ncbi:MAG: hypothetical protein NTY69_07080 [Methylococcales bacterium]|nr:hypothetical protein [Methylococcales bacterium]
MLTSTAQAAINLGPYYGTWNANTTYPVGSLITEKDQTYIAIIKNKNKSVSANTDKWKLLGSVITGLNGVQGIQGPKGDTGAKGEQGIQGLAGPQGIQGEQGIQGLQGPRGPAGLPQAGNNVGDMQYWDGTQWQVVPVIQPDPNIKPTLALCEGVPTWVLYYCPGTSPYTIGETGPAGGKVFYVTDGGLHGLEVAPADVNNGAYVAWGCYGTSIAGAQGTAIGTGAANTAAIVNGCSEANTVAKIVDAYVLNGYSDWYLPSKDELNLLYTQRSVVGGFYAFSAYWSSSEFDSGGAWLQGFHVDFIQLVGSKSDVGLARAVRAF